MKIAEIMRISRVFRRVAPRSDMDEECWIRPRGVPAHSHPELALACAESVALPALQENPLTLDRMSQWGNPFQGCLWL